MKSTFLSCAGLLALSGPLMASGLYSASNLYFMGEDAAESIPIKWSVGLDLIWDDNVNPTLMPGTIGFEDSGTALNPFVEAAFVSVSPQTTMDLYARLGLLYYFDKPAGMGDDTYSDSKVGFNLTHRFNERVRFVTRNYVSYELEPDYSAGFANNRLNSEYLYYSTDNSIGVRWTERFATYTGFRVTDIDYDDFIGANSQDRFTWTVYNDFRYQLNPQTLLTASYRYSETDAGGIANDSTNQYVLAGVEYRFSPNTVGILRGGAQFREVDGIGGEDSTNPYFEAMLRSQINEQFGVRGFLRYGIEDYDTVYPGFALAPGLAGTSIEFDERAVLRIGVSGDYAITPRFRIFGGVNYIYSNYDSARITFPVNVPLGINPEENLLNLYVGMSMQLNDWLYANASYNFTNSDSDILNRDYDRNRISVGMRAEF
jgi:opacity protein-like surface antigen